MAHQKNDFFQVSKLITPSADELDSQNFLWERVPETGSE